MYLDLLVCAPGFFPEMFEDGSENSQICSETKIEDVDKIIGIDDNGWFLLLKILKTLKEILLQNYNFRILSIKRKTPE